MIVVHLNSFVLTYLQKFVARLTEDKEAVFHDVCGLHRGDVAVRWCRRVRAGLSCARKPDVGGLAGSIAASLNLAIRSSWFINETTCKESLPQWGRVLKI